MTSGCRRFLHQLSALRKILIVVCALLAALPLILVLDRKEAQCAYVVVVMATFWCTEAIPIAVTSLLPIVMVPMIGIMKASDIAKEYANNTLMLFIGGLIVAIAVEKWMLHKRLALAVLMLVGAEPRWLMFGVMFPSWFLSMWISNTATTAMMIPITQAVLDQMESKDIDKDGRHSLIMPTKNISRDKAKITHTESQSEITVTEEIQLEVVGEKELQNTEKQETADVKKSGEAVDGINNKGLDHQVLCKALCIAVAYSANVGGIGTLTGTPPNIVLLGEVDKVFGAKKLDNPITFATWMILCLPLSVILFFVVWIWLQIYFLRCRSRKTTKEEKKRVRQYLLQSYRDLGPFSFAEVAVCVHFVLLVVLWITRDLGGTTGWGRLFPKGYVSDATPAMFISILLFIFPSSVKDLFASTLGNGKSKYRPLLEWKDVHAKMPWGIVFLMAGGFALAKACQNSGLTAWVGEQLSGLEGMDSWVINLIVCYVVAAATEFTSNTATTIIMMPIMAQLALAFSMNPLYFMWPAALASSFAYMLPVATPPNAIVFSTGHLRVIDMAMAGFVLNIVCVPLLEMAVHTWGNAYFNMDILPPEFANATGVTQ